ncbi:hypothetical protein [Pseudorhodoferax sp. Leaf274]|uniref:hypothetical protein n=1 Tax=Pseudorhodoferax sp. Leaf274 TaxID=1736318 RepID=UPI000703713B|nr:hypothetical protein [Pseudorhodoferax sp. Leaf274]KQP36140.1 hypothetical protein ASF44_16360 [Pseudorhodoferax sp. Leaf274]
MATMRSTGAIPADLIATLTKLPRLQTQLRDLSQDVAIGIPEAVAEALDKATDALEIAEETKTQQFLLLSVTPSLPNARGLTVGTGLATTDSGPGNAFQLRLQAFLAALSQLTGNGIVAKTASGAELRAIQAGSSRIEVMYGDGADGNPSIDIDEPSLDLGSMGGLLGVSQGGTGVTVLSAFSAHNNAVLQTIPAGAFTKVNLSTELFDLNGDFASSAWTPPAGRPVLIQGSVLLAMTEAAPVDVAIYKNGVIFKAGGNAERASASSVRVAVSCMDVPDGDDVYDLRVYHGASGAQGTSGAPANTWMSGSML